MPRSPRSDSKLQQEMADPEYTLLDVLDVGAIKGWPEAALVKEVERRLGAGEAVDQQVDRSSTPLMTAAANGWPSVVRVLLAHQANPFQKNRWKEDVLSSAKLGNNTEVIALSAAARAAAGEDGLPRRTQPSAPTKLSPPDFIKARYSKRSAFALICSNQPSRVDTDQLAELFFPGSDAAGAIGPDLLEDDAKLDDLDSGIGKAFHEALSKVNSKRKWGLMALSTDWSTTLTTKKK